MKKLGLLVMPLMTASFLASCNNGGGDKPTPEPEEEFTVTFDANGGDLTGETSFKVKDGTLFKDIANKPDAHKDPEGAYTFNGWALVDDSQKSISGDYKITNDLTVYAIYTPTAYANVTFSEASSECTLSYNGEALTKGLPCKIPAGVDVTLKIESNQGYFPILDKKVEIHEAQTYSLNLIEKEIVVKVAKGNTCVIKAVAENVSRGNLENYSWSEINILSKAGIAKGLFTIGDTKKVQLKHQDSEGDGADIISDGELYQTVRLIGINEDYTELPIGGGTPDPDKAIGLTFEFVDYISDAKGYSLATYWNNIENKAAHNYKSSSIRKALTNEGEGDLHWFEKDDVNFSTDTNYANKSVLDMLPDEISNALVTTSKYINIKDNDVWEEQIVEDKLFLLSGVEMGVDGHQYEEKHTVSYSYYKEHTSIEDPIRIKYQIKARVDARADSLQVTAGEYTGDKYSFAGYNSSAENEGGSSYLRSPYLSVSSNTTHSVNAKGFVGTNGANSRATAIAPAFCI